MLKSTTKSLTQTIIATYLFTFLILITLGSLMFFGQGDYTKSYKERYDSYVIADELRQSSDDLTKFIRMYAATGDVYYKELYLEVLKIRNGELPRPDGYEKIYWDLRLPNKGKSESKNAPITLKERMKQSGFTTTELELLSLAEENSNILVNIELLAIRSIENNLSAKDKELLLSGESNLDFALRILNDQNYNEQKSLIMNPIKEFYDMFDARTNIQVNKTSIRQSNFLIFILVFLFVLLILIVTLFIKLFKAFKDNEIILEKKVKERTFEIHEKDMVLLEASEQLVKSEKMAFLGGLVAGITHEVNTTIGVAVTIASHISDTTQEYIEKLSENKLTKSSLTNYFNKIGEASELILSSMDKAESLIKSFKKAAVDQNVDDDREIDLKENINEILISLHNKLKRTNHQITVTGDDITITTNPGAIYQILTNLIFNSLIHAFGETDHGNISIDLSDGEEYVIIKYKDDGKGIPNEHLSKIYDPFYTTNRSEGGSGLGLKLGSSPVLQTL